MLTQSGVLGSLSIDCPRETLYFDECPEQTTTLKALTFRQDSPTAWRKRAQRTDSSKA
jgi:hypothetical protein